LAWEVLGEEGKKPVTRIRRGRRNDECELPAKKTEAIASLRAPGEKAVFAGGSHQTGGESGIKKKGGFSHQIRKTISGVHVDWGSSHRNISSQTNRFRDLWGPGT